MANVWPWTPSQHWLGRALTRRVLIDQLAPLCQWSKSEAKIDDAARRARAMVEHWQDEQAKDRHPDQPDGNAQ